MKAIAMSYRKCRANRYPAQHAKWLRHLSTGVPLPKKIATQTATRPYQ
jgi:hypothetical protein